MSNLGFLSGRSIHFKTSVIILLRFLVCNRKIILFLSLPRLYFKIIFLFPRINIISFRGRGFVISVVVPVRDNYFLIFILLRSINPLFLLKLPVPVSSIYTFISIFDFLLFLRFFGRGVLLRSLDRIFWNLNWF